MGNFLENKVYFIVNTDRFLDHHYHLYVEKSGRQLIRAYEADKSNKTHHIKSTLGEFFEREVLINYKDRYLGKCILISMLNGNKKEVDLSELLFKDKFVDSCGMASHTNSKELLWSAYKEYFERQSYISNFLFQLNATKIRIDRNESVMSLHKYLNNYLDEIYYYNISLNKKIYVVLAIGWSKYLKAAGLGVSRDITKAIKKSQKEIMQYFAVSYNKKNVKIIDKIKDGTKDLYHNNFDKLSVDNFIKYYNYLEKSEEKDLCEFNQMCRYSMQDIVYDNYNKYGMEPYVGMFSNRENYGVKVVKIKDFSWFPHMRPELYSKDIIQNVEKYLNKKMKSNVDLLPFA